MSVPRLVVPNWVSLPYVEDEHAPGILGFLLVYAYLLRDVTLGRVYAFGDFPPYYGLRALTKFTSHWHEGGLGYAYDFHALPAYVGLVTLVGDAVTTLVGGVVDVGALAGNLFFLALVPLGFVGFLRFSKRYLTSVTARYLGATCYALNPVVVAEFVNGGATTLLAFAGLPFVLHYCWRVVERDSWDAALLAATAFGLMAVSPWIAFWFVAPFAAVLAYRTRRTPRTLTKLVAAGVLGVGLTLPGLQHVLQRAAGFEGGTGAFQATLAWNYGAATLVPLVRLAGNQGTLAMNAFGYNAPDAHLVGLVIPLVALLAWQRRELHPFFLVAAVLVVFMLATKAGYTTPLFETFAPLYSLRNPAKLQFPLAYSLALLFGAGAETLVVRARRAASRRRSSLSPEQARQRATAVVAGLLVLSLLVYAAPASGSFGLAQVRGDDYYVSADETAVAERLDGRVLWAPYGYTTQLHLRHVYPAHVGVRSGGDLQGIQNVDYVEALFADFARDPGSVHAALASLDVRYVVVSRDPPDRIGTGEPEMVTRYGAPWLAGDPGAYERALTESSVFESAFETDRYAVFRVVGTGDAARTERVDGLNAVYYPRSTELFHPPDENFVDNGDFGDGLSGWWSGGQHTVYRVVRSDSGFGDRAVHLQAVGDYPSPLAQRTTVPSVPLLFDVETDDRVDVSLAWYDGDGPTGAPVSTDRFSESELPAVVQPNGSTVAVRIRPADDEATVDGVSLTPARHPPETGYVGNTAGVPGVTVDGWKRANESTTTVAVNLQPWKAERIGADVRIVDAETRIGGHLVYDDRYRQGVALSIPDGRLPEAVPDDARPVVLPGPDGPVLDYWVVGTFDDGSVTVYRTSYHDRWTATNASDHRRADGWANAFVDASPSAVHWGGFPVRPLVVVTWLGLWGLVAALHVRSRRR